MLDVGLSVQVVPSGGVAVGQAQAAGGTLGYVQGTGGDAGAGYVQAAGRQSQQEEAASADSDQGFMQDIGFSQFFNVSPHPRPDQCATHHLLTCH